MSASVAYWRDKIRAARQDRDAFEQEWIAQLKYGSGDDFFAPQLDERSFLRCLWVAVRHPILTVDALLSRGDCDCEF